MISGRQALLALFSLVCACRFHLGRPPADGGLSVGRVEAPVAEPAVGDALESALAARIRARGAGGERILSARVVEASLAPGAGSDGRVVGWSATLAVEFQETGAEGPVGQVRVFRRTLEVAASSSDPGSFSAARTQAFDRLAGLVASDAVDYFLYSPEAR